MRADGSTVATLRVVDACPFCDTAVPEISKLFAELGLPLIVRKPHVSELHSLPSYPALVVPKDGVPSLIIIGPDARALREQPDWCRFNAVNGAGDGDGSTGVHHRGAAPDCEGR